MIKHNRCRGIRLWKWGRFQIELWFVPNGEWIEPHIHHRIDSSIMLLFGRMMGHIEGRGIGHVRRFKFYEVKREVTHSAVAERACIFINVERWTDAVTSAADDFTAA